MQLLIHVVFLFAIAMCNCNVSHLHPFDTGVSTEKAKQEFINGTGQDSTDLNQENSIITDNERSPQPSKDSKNDVPITEKKNLNKAAKPPIQDPFNNTLENMTRAEEKGKKEKNEVPAVHQNKKQYDNATENNQTTNNGEKTSLQLETTLTSSLNCSIMWPECTNPLNALQDVSRELTRFSVILYKTLSSQNEDSNIVISPFSIALGLSQLMLGSSGKTREDMLKIMFSGMNDSQCVHNAIRNFTKHNSFISANEIFYRKDISLKEEFTSQSENFYGSNGTQLKKEKNKSLKQINNWVSKKTNQLIPSVFKELPDFEIMLINVIFYQGKWLNRFEPKFTKKEDFQTTSSTVHVPMMNNNKYPLQSIRDSYLEAHVARFPLSDNCSLIIFLPISQENDALQNVEKRLSGEIVNLLMTQLEEKSPRATSVSLPKLKLDSDFGLTETLGLLGLHDLFENPNFCALSDSPELALSDVRHRAILEIKEDGAKAAAATSVTVARTMSMFSVHRPFLYILANDINKIPIAIGRVTDPSN
ncbi:plasma protease C1 inhibitor [Dendropsophus ebraccatus]|uniref:plasma protease C1 inhibitor n=1 Tax=Dendropsophus ebraccatus TaxID=150705 RepID=UPI0038317AC8